MNTQLVATPSEKTLLKEYFENALSQNPNFKATFGDFAKAMQLDTRMTEDVQEKIVRDALHFVEGVDGFAHLSR